MLDRQSTGAKDCNQAAKAIDTRLALLGASRLIPRLGMIRDAMAFSRNLISLPSVRQPCAHGSIYLYAFAFVFLEITHSALKS